MGRPGGHLFQETKMSKFDVFQDRGHYATIDTLEEAKQLYAYSATR